MEKKHPEITNVLTFPVGQIFSTVGVCVGKLNWFRNINKQANCISHEVLSKYMIYMADTMFKFSTANGDTFENKFFDLRSRTSCDKMTVFLTNWMLGVRGMEMDSGVSHLTIMHV